MHMASEKGSSSWLAALPIESHGSQGRLPRCHISEVWLVTSTPALKVHMRKILHSRPCFELTEWRFSQ